MGSGGIKAARNAFGTFFLIRAGTRRTVRAQDTPSYLLEHRGEDGQWHPIEEFGTAQEAGEALDEAAADEEEPDMDAWRISEMGVETRRRLNWLALGLLVILIGIAVFLATQFWSH